MDFGLSEEQQMLQETVRGFVTNECPVAHLREVFDGDAEFDAKTWQGLVEMGISGLAVSEQRGGAGMELLDLALVAEVLGAGAVPSPFFGHSLGTLAVSSLRRGSRSSVSDSMASCVTGTTNASPRRLSQSASPGAKPGTK